MKKVNCDECGIFLFESDSDSNGVNGARAQNKGFIYKNACLFSEEYSSLFFCNEDCAKSFYKKHIPKNPEMSKIINDLKKDIPKMAKDVSAKMENLKKILTQAEHPVIRKSSNPNS